MATKRTTLRNHSAKAPKKCVEPPPTTEEIERIEQYASEFQTVVDSYLEDHPNWIGETLLWIMEFGFKQLRHYLEEEEIPEVNWENPFLNYNFPMTWDWEDWKTGQASRLIPYTPLTPKNTRTKEIAYKTMAKSLVQLTTYTSLHHFTHFVGIEKNGDCYTPILSPTATDELDQIKRKRDRARAFQDFFLPFSMGAGLLSFDLDDIPPDGKLPKSAIDELSRLHELIDIPGIIISANIDGYKIKLTLCFQISPYEIDVINKHACFPMMAGIMIEPDIGEDEDIEEALDDPRLNPSTWTKKDRKKLWDAILGNFKKLRSELPTPQEQKFEEAVVEITAKLKITVRPGETDISERMERLLASFQENGEILQANFSKQGITLNASASSVELDSLLKIVETEPDKNKKGEALEELMIKLFQSLDGFDAKKNARTETEEIDLVIINNSSEARWKDCGPLILVECKNWSSNCGKNELVQFESKIRNRKGQCKLGFLVSWNGFGTALKKELLRSSHDHAVVGLLSGKDIREAVSSRDFLSVLQRCWEESVMA